MEIFIANLNTSIEEELLSKLFEVFGTVDRCSIAKDRATGDSKGFGFVVMENDSEAQDAINDLDGRELAGKVLNVKESIKKTVVTERSRDQRENISHKNEGKVSASNSVQRENVFVNTVDEAKYTKAETEDGFVKISFLN
jgi:RNA recognition motif-containing protein